jgi:large subunit ribosomal protein L21e
MVQRIGGTGRKTRGKFTRRIREKGKMSVSKFFQDFADGDKVVLKVNPAYQAGRYFRRFHGKVGTVAGKQGRCYLVSVSDHAMPKTVIVHPIHLIKYQ